MLMAASAVSPIRKFFSRPPGISPRLLTRALLAPILCAQVFAQSPVRENVTFQTEQPEQVDPAIAGALARISPDDVRADILKLVSFGNRSTLSSMDKDQPAGQGINAAADWLFDEFTRISEACGGCLQVHRDDFTELASSLPNSRIKRDTRIQNIYAVLPGIDPAQRTRRVLVTGHYDSRVTDVFDTHSPAPGANDDASGVAVSLESARTLSQLKFPATIIFVAVAGEEQGLNGSRHLAKLARAENWDLEAVLNNDIVGGDSTPGRPGQDENTVRIFSEGVPAPATLEQLRLIQTLGSESDSSSRELARAIAGVAATYFRSHASGPAVVPGRPHNELMRFVPAFHPTLIFRRDRFLRGGDHTSFNQEGFPAVRFTEWQENFDHQHQTPRTENGVRFEDNIQFVDMDYVANVARLNAAALATFASAPGEPQDVRILTQALDNSSQLIWKAPAGAPPDMVYEVLWRPTDAPDWTNDQSAGKSLSLTLPISKDNVVFGVRSADSAGHRSPAVAPLPQGR